MERGIADAQVATRASVTELAKDWSWFPNSLDANGTLTFVKVDREKLGSATFLAEGWAPEHWPRRTARLSDVHGILVSPTARPHLNFIWPTAFCCSTAIARALDREDRNLSLREPGVLMDLARVKRALPPGRKFPSEPLDTIFRLLARSTSDRERVTIKPTSAVNCFLPDSALLTAGKSLLLYCDCRNFLIATAKRRERGRAHQRGLFALLLPDGHEQHDWPTSKLFAMSDLQIAALVWHMHMSQFLRSAALFEAGRLAALDCTDYLEQPARVLHAIDNFFQLGLGEEHVRHVIEGPLLATHSKNATVQFSTDQRDEEYAALAQFLGSELDEIVAWSYESCKTPRALPFPDLLAVEPQTPKPQVGPA